MRIATGDAEDTVIEKKRRRVTMSAFNIARFRVKPDACSSVLAALASNARERASRRAEVGKGLGTRNTYTRA
jgi:hypothetical protein